MGQPHQRNHQDVDRDQREQESFPPVKRAARDHREQQHRRHRHTDVARQPEKRQRQGDTDELGHDGQRVENEQVTDAEPAPEPAEPLEDQFGVPDAGDRAQAQHHLLIDVEDRDQQRQRPHTSAMP